MEHLTTHGWGDIIVMVRAELLFTLCLIDGKFELASGQEDGCRRKLRES